jgi:MoxR-like ATPase
LNSLLTILNERLFDNGNKRVEVPLLCLVGASNELPESEELDALYDRFLLRSCVEQVSSSSLSTLLSMKAGELPGKAAGSANTQNANNASAMPLKVSDFRGVKAAAEAGVEVPQSVVDLIVDLRRYVFPNPNPNTVWPDYSH